MPVKVTRTRNLTLTLSRLSQYVSAPMMRTIGKDIADKVKKRTQRGTDENNRAFARMADGSKSRLTDTGQMVEKDLGVLAVTKTTARVGFSTPRSRQIATYHQYGTRKMPERPFMGVPKAWIEAAKKTVYSAVRKALGKS